MSERNTGLFVSGHAPPADVLKILLAIPGVNPADFQGEEALRVGHGERAGRKYTHVALRLFEVGGLLLFDGAELPGADELEMRLAGALSQRFGGAVYLSYNDEDAYGGSARFEGGRLVFRQVVDGRGNRELIRDLTGERPLSKLDASDWVWAPIAEAIAAGAAPLLGEGVRTDDDIEALITGANAAEVKASAAAPRAAAPPPPAASPAPPRREEPAPSGGLRGLARGMLRKLRDR